MKSPQIVIRERTNAAGSLSCQVDAGKVSGKRQRKQFQTRREADDFAKKLTLLAWLCSIEKKRCDLVPYISIGLFAGLRSAELEKLVWKDIHLHQGTINVHAENAKTARRRIVRMPPNLKEWLAFYAERRSQGGMIVDSCWRDHFQELTKAAEISPWPKNALRHSFESYFLALEWDRGKVAHEMGNSPTSFTRTTRNWFSQ